MERANDFLTLVVPLQENGAFLDGYLWIVLSSQTRNISIILLR